MHDGPNIVPIAALIGDHARAAMLTALMSGQAMTATELATEANITKQTASGHLTKLRDAGLVNVASQGRHRYYQLSNKDVAELLESLMGVAQRTGNTRIRPGPNDPELRTARVCYDHLAGTLGVELFDSLRKRNYIKTGRDPSLVDLTGAGENFLESAGVSLIRPKRSRRPMCRGCLDWSVRRHHLAGVVGASLLKFCYDNGWAKRVEGSRVVKFTTPGEENFRDTLLR